MKLDRPFRAQTLVSALFLAAGLIGLRAEPTRYTTPSGDWSTSGNWSGGIPTGAGSSYVNDNNVVTISTGSNSVGEFWVGNCCGGGANSAGSVNQTGGTLTINNNLHVGNDDRNGTYTISNGTLNGAGKTLNISRGGGAATSTGVFNMNGGEATFATTNLGNDSLSSRVRLAQFNQTAGTFVNTGNVVAGNSDSSRGTVNLTGGAYTTVNTYLGNAANSHGVLTVNGATATHSGNIEAAHGANATGTLNLNAGNLTLNALNFGDNANSSFTVNHTGGSLTTNQWADFARNATSNGTWNQSGGTFNAGGSNHHMGLRGHATMNISGGVMNKTGGEFDIAEGRDNTLTATGVLNLSGTGLINQTGGNLNLARTAGTGTLNVSGGTFNKTSAGNNLFGNTANSHGYVNVTGGVLALNGSTQVGASGRGTWTQTGGVANMNGAWFEIAQNNGGIGTLGLSGGQLNYTGANQFVVGSRGNGTLNVSGTGRLDAGNTLRVAGSWEGQTLTGRVNQTGGTVLSTNVQIGNSNGTGIYNLDGGTFRINTLNNFAGPSSAFNWGAGSLTMRSPDAGNATGSDLSSGTGFTQVRNTTTTFTSNANLTTGNGVNAASRLDLGGIYLSSGNVLFDHFTVGAGRTLDLASNADILEFDDDTVYLLRPFGFNTEDYASLPLVTTTGGSTITGTFDSFLGLANDGRGFSMSTFAVTTATANTLAANTWYLEQTGSAITFHYKVAGTVPEPDTFALLALSAIGLRTARSLRDQRRRVAESS